MTHTVLLKEILEKANHIKEEFGSEYLCASHIVVAVTDFCRTKYTGFSISDMTYWPSRFEEERLRYLFAKETRVASFFRIHLSHNTKSGVREEEFDVSYCERIAALRSAEVLSSDVVFLCALIKLHESYRRAVRSAQSEASVMALLQDTDTNVYNYVVENIEGVRAELKKKADEAAAIRDWKPAAKFAEPEALAAMFFGKIEKNNSGNAVTLKFPKFFGTTDLKVSIHRVQDAYYIHDNGCAIRHLSKQVKDAQKQARILKKVCASCWISKGRMTDRFFNGSQFLWYLQKLVFVAQADLYYTRASGHLVCRDKAYVYADPEKAEPLDESELLEMLKKSICFDYDEDKGLYYWLDMRYSLDSGRAAYLLETLEKGCIRISDKKKGKLEGELFEQFYWGHDDPALYEKYISGIAARFDAEFDGKDVYLTDKTDNFFKAMLRFFNLAVLLSEFGRSIEPPKLRSKG